jgi:hypothetical protein
MLGFLPRHIDQHGALRGSLEAAEEMAELRLAGVPPPFADSADDGKTAEVPASVRG